MKRSQRKNTRVTKGAKEANRAKIINIIGIVIGPFLWILCAIFREVFPAGVLVSMLCIGILCALILIPINVVALCKKEWLKTVKLCLGIFWLVIPFITIYPYLTFVSSNAFYNEVNAFFLVSALFTTVISIAIIVSAVKPKVSNVESLRTNKKKKKEYIDDTF